jgi:hypothetical protein
VLASRDGHAAFRQRRVVIKTRLIKMAGRGIAGPRVHLRYLQRDGVTREGLPGDLYDAKLDRADGGAFLERSDGDRHQFRFIVSPEDTIEYQDLKGVTRRLMARMEEDLDTRLDWIAVDHRNTGRPHTHVVLRGRDDRGKDLIIAREYLSQGMRERAAEIVSLDLGPRTDHEIETRLRAEVEQARTRGRALIRMSVHIADRHLEAAGDLVDRWLAADHQSGDTTRRAFVGNWTHAAILSGASSSRTPRPSVDEIGGAAPIISMSTMSRILSSVPSSYSAPRKKSRAAAGRFPA